MAATLPATPSPAPTRPSTPSPAPTLPPPTPPPATPPAASIGLSSLHGTAFFDVNADGQVEDGEAGLPDLEITLTFANGQRRTTHTDENGAFSFDSLVGGAYHVSLSTPANYIPTTDAGQDVELDPSTETTVLFGFITTEAAGLSPDGSGPDPTADDEQIIALASVTSLPLRFAEGRDLLNQVQKRVLGDGLVWLGVPFRSQMDGGDFQYVNCGPASLTMALAGFGLEVGPSQVRDYLNNMIDNFDTDLGTSLDVLSNIGRQAGLTPMDLYSDKGG
ncbi:MAG TPA: SdrD B-like domain-containing protein, partial [Chloroflexota bacterium]